MHIIILLLLVIIMAGCASPMRDQERFQSELNRQVGRILDIDRSVTFSGKSYEQHGTKYIFDFGAGCKIELTVKETTNEILNWKYLSEPANCVAEVNWLGPW